MTAHHCQRQHRAYTAFAHCAFPRAAWISGDGPFAVVVKCGAGSVRLFPDADAARRTLAAIGAPGSCSGRCTGDHQLVQLDLGEVPS